jgi:ABC-type polysaccharide/polyol phosphate transport system ATPase subunit
MIITDDAVDSLMDDNDCMEVPLMTDLSDRVNRQKVTIKIVNVSLFVQVKTIKRQNNLSTVLSPFVPGNDDDRNDDDRNDDDMTTTSKTNNNNNTRSKKKKMILSHVSANIDSGRLIALMGGSGSGKTTLLNVLAGRIHPASKDPDKSPGSHLFFRSLLSSQYTGDGQILFNGRVPTGSQRRELVGYGINITH